MKKSMQIMSLAALTVMVTACSDAKEAPDSDAVTETQMDEVDVIDGTINDDMVDVDTQQSEDGLAEDSDDAGEAEDEETAKEE